MPTTQTKQPVYDQISWSQSAYELGYALNNLNVPPGVKPQGDYLSTDFAIWRHREGGMITYTNSLGKRPFVAHHSFDGPLVNQDGSVKVFATFEEAHAARLADQETDALVNILGTAIESGYINYWCARADTDGDRAPGATYFQDNIRWMDVILYVTEDESANPTLKRYKLDLAGLKVGVEKWAEHRDRSVSGLLENNDAEDADNILQYALFGEIVYG